MVILFITACSSSDGNDGGTEDFRRGGNTPASDYFEYKITFNSPNSFNKSINDEMPVNIDFKSSTGKTVHYIEIRIYNKLDSTEIYNMPSNNHVDDDSGSYNYTDALTLSVSNGFSVDTNWILEAKVWGTNPEEEDVIMVVEFYIKS